MTTYDKHFYESIDADSYQSALQILPEIVSLRQIDNVVDVGCGTGSWLSAALNLGVKEVHGFDGDYVNRGMLRIPSDAFTPINLAKGIPELPRSDLCICLEVAEHLPSDMAEDLVRALVKTSDMVLFSAAIPGQGGTSHLNEQWQSYWARKFKHHNYCSIDIVRRLHWSNSNVCVWYRQNAILYVNDCLLTDQIRIHQEENLVLLDKVHPELFSHHIRPASVMLPFGRALRFADRLLPKG